MRLVCELTRLAQEEAQIAGLINKQFRTDDEIYQENFAAGYRLGYMLSLAERIEVQFGPLQVATVSMLIKCSQEELKQLSIDLKRIEDSPTVQNSGGNHAA